MKRLTILLSILFLFGSIGCDTQHLRDKRSKDIILLTCYSGGKMVMERRVLHFGPGQGGIKPVDSYWDIEREHEVRIRGLECVLEPTGEKYHEDSE